jgi:hypothetical protein
MAVGEAAGGRWRAEYLKITAATDRMRVWWRKLRESIPLGW